MGNAVVLGNIGTDHDGFHPSHVVAALPIEKWMAFRLRVKKTH